MLLLLNPSQKNEWTEACLRVEPRVRTLFRRCFGVHDDELDSKPSLYMNMNSKEKGSVLCSMRRAIRTKSSNLPCFPFVVEFANLIFFKIALKTLFSLFSSFYFH